jgi:hypothetical protein
MDESPMMLQITLPQAEEEMGEKMEQPCVDTAFQKLTRPWQQRQQLQR